MVSGVGCQPGTFPPTVRADLRCQSFLHLNYKWNAVNKLLSDKSVHLISNREDLWSSSSHLAPFFSQHVQNIVLAGKLKCVSLLTNFNENKLCFIQVLLF